MRYLLILALGTLLACSGGGGTNTPPAPAPAPTPVAPVAIPRGTYRATSLTGAAYLGHAASVGQATPIGNVVQNMVVTDGGSVRMELPGWEHLRCNIYTDATGVLQLGLDPTLTHADGTTVALTLTGTMVGNRMTGTTNGGAFDVTLTGIQDVPVDMATKAGTWISTASSNGQVLRLTLPAVLNSSFNMTADAYANNSDAAAKVNSLGVYSGTFGWTDDAHLRNCFNFGLIWSPTGGGTLPGGVGGLAYFDASGNLVVMAALPSSSAEGSGQLSAVFTKE